MMNYPKQNAYLRVKCLDSISYDVQEYVWVYNTNVGHSKRRLTTAHRSILHATKSKDNHFYKDNIACLIKTLLIRESYKDLKMGIKVGRLILGSILT